MQWAVLPHHHGGVEISLLLPPSTPHPTSSPLAAPHLTRGTPERLTELLTGPLTERLSSLRKTVAAIVVTGEEHPHLPAPGTGPGQGQGRLLLIINTNARSPRETEMTECPAGCNDVTYTTVQAFIINLMFLYLLKVYFHQFANYYYCSTF